FLRVLPLELGSVTLEQLLEILITAGVIKLDYPKSFLIAPTTPRRHHNAFALAITLCCNFFVIAGDILTNYCGVIETKCLLMEKAMIAREWNCITCAYKQAESGKLLNVVFLPPEFGKCLLIAFDAIGDRCGTRMTPKNKIDFGKSIRDLTQR